MENQLTKNSSEILLQQELSSNIKQNNLHESKNVKINVIISLKINMFPYIDRFEMREESLTTKLIRLIKNYCLAYAEKWLDACQNLRVFWPKVLEQINASEKEILQRIQQYQIQINNSVGNDLILLQNKLDGEKLCLVYLQRIKKKVLRILES
ncbi:hypothetical protein OXYTRIMIC_122 [Oxytricha trifallax]|uniref:Uncharacterized protein n=1 Tax=Oxytricha trifallax TaxID=1172189 RepID=A0A073I0X9_9SPIT|nr:hypothetical protein OXYTRIMIC_122 [Oxytricha trifallax]